MPAPYPRQSKRKAPFKDQGLQRLIAIDAAMTRELDRIIDECERDGIEEPHRGLLKGIFAAGWAARARFEEKRAKQQHPGDSQTMFTQPDAR